MALAHAFERAVEELQRDAAFAGVEFVAHSARRRAGEHALQVVLDRAGGADVALCERIAGALNAQLHAFDEPYTLEVETAGLNRPLLKPGDYQRFAGRAAKISTTLSICGQKTHRGTLVGVVGTNVILHTTGGDLRLPLATIRSAHLEYDIRSDLRRAKQERKHHEHHA
jgi:ribosome maturation factor RimP